MKYALPTSALLLAAVLSSCESTSTQMVRYSGGAVKTSTIEYRFTGPPLLRAHNRQPYYLTINGSFDKSQLTSLRRNGMRAVSDPDQARLAVAVVLGDVVQGEPGAMKLGGAWVPAFEVEVPYEVTMTSKRGAVIGRRQGSHEDFLTFSGGQRFETREQAVAALDLVQDLGKESAERKARQSAVPKALAAADALAARLFKEQVVAMDVPVVRAAAGLDLEEAFEILSDASGPTDVTAALTRYQREGLQQLKDDGSPNDTASYGVACGIAACQLMLGDLAGAWQTASVALEYQPDGREVNEIRRVIYEQEKITGVRVIPAEEREAIDSRVQQVEKLGRVLEKLVN